VRGGDLGADGKPKPGEPVEPLVLRAATGECIELTLENCLPAKMPDLTSLQVLPGTLKRDRDADKISTTFNYNLIQPSAYVGLHPQLEEYDVIASDGVNVNVSQSPVHTLAPGDKRTYV
jgi:hypothetical protein